MKLHRRKPHRWHLSPRLRKDLLLGSLIVLGLFVVTNLLLWAVYANRTYPRTKVMQSSIGSVTYTGLSDTISQKKLLPNSLTFVYDQQKTTVSLNDLGVSKDLARTTNSARERRSWLPIVNLFKTTELQAPIAINSGKLQQQSPALAGILRRDPVNARIALKDGATTIEKAKDGYTLDTSRLAKAIDSALDKGLTSVPAPVTIKKPNLQASDLKDQKTDLDAQLKTAITVKYADKSNQPGSAEIGSWYTVSGSTYLVVPDRIQTYLAQIGAGFGIKVKNLPGTANNLADALRRHQASTITLEQQVALKTMTYCTATRGVDASYLPGLKSKAAESFTDSRGWSIGGLVEFKEVSSGCDFTIWLTAASQMPSFGAICDAMWSCRVGPNVVINFDRWQNASPAWNAAGLSLDVYRNMAINHETGHWLGFDHTGCPGAGQLAPVMEQQSVDLQGCTFNAWPTATEIAHLRRTLGI